MGIKIKNILSRLTLTQRYIAGSLIIIIVGTLVIGWWVNIQITSGVIHRTSAAAALYVDNFIAHDLQELATTGQVQPDHLKELEQLISNTPLGQQIVAFKVWNTAGVVQYSTDETVIGKTFEIEAGLAQALAGQVSSSISTLSKPENVSELAFGSRLIETYIPVRLAGTEQVIAVVEFYQKVDELLSELNAAQRRSWLVVASVMALIFLLLIGFVKQASVTIEQQKVRLSNQVSQLTEVLEQNQDLHERVRRAAARVTTLNERLLRRVGSELHDGPAQDLSLALLKLDPIIEQSEKSNGAGSHVQRADTQLIAIQTAMQNALKELRNISTGLGLPELAELSMEDTILRVVRTHERRTNTRVNLELCELPESCPLPVKITLYRLIQEALNNSYRHAQGIGQEVIVSQHEGQILVEISDQGEGFAVSKATLLDSHLGIAGMRERVESLGGHFMIESGQGNGTKVTATFNLPSEGAKDER